MSVALCGIRAMLRKGVLGMHAQSQRGACRVLGHGSEEICERLLTQLNYTELERRIIYGYEVEWLCECGRKRCREQARACERVGT